MSPNQEENNSTNNSCGKNRKTTIRTLYMFPLVAKSAIRDTHHLTPSYSTYHTLPHMQTHDTLNSFPCKWYKIPYTSSRPFSYLLMATPNRLQSTLLKRTHLVGKFQVHIIISSTALFPSICSRHTLRCLNVWLKRLKPLIGQLVKVLFCTPVIFFSHH